MKKSKIAVLAVAVSALSCAGLAACADSEKPAGHTHKYTDWTITTAPTMDEGGVLTGVCAADQESTTVDVPKLTDDTFWTATDIAATETTDPGVTYSNGTYNVHVDIYSHEYGKWTVKADAAPTADKDGTIERVCLHHADQKQTETVKKLTDTSFWTATPTAGTATADPFITYSNGTYDVQVVVPTHQYGEWTVKADAAPNKEKGGTIERVCLHHADVKQTETVKAVTDESWTIGSDSVAAKHGIAGKTVYVHSEYSVKVEIPEPALEHEFGEWTYTENKKPKLDAKGEATRVCACGLPGATQTVDVPELGDTNEWTCESVPADYAHAGYDLYTSKTGYPQVKIETDPMLTAPFANKTYVAYELDASDASKTNKAISAWKWSSPEATVTLDGASAFGGGAVPFRAHISMALTDAATGAITITERDADYPDDGEPTIKEDGKTSTYYGFIDVTPGDDNSAIIVRQRSASYNDVYVYVPFGFEGTEVKSSAWTAGMAISVTHGEKTVNIYVDNDEEKVYFGVEFAAGKGADATAITADNCFNAPLLYIKNANGDIIKALAYNGTTMVETDGVDGDYVGEISVEGYIQRDATLALDGLGGAVITFDQDQTKIAARYEKTADGIGLYIIEDDADKWYYDVALDGAAFTAVLPTVDISFDYGGKAANITNTYNKNIAVAFAAPDIEGFLGWYADSAYSQAIDAAFIPTADATIYAKFSGFMMTVRTDDGVENNLFFADGDTFETVLPKLGIDTANDRYFVKWVYLDGATEKDVSMSGVLDETANGLTVVAKWETLPAYYGTFTGGFINVSYGGTATLSIDEHGALTMSYERGSFGAHSFTGTVNEYDEATKTLTWTATGETEQRVMMFDAQAGVVVFANDDYASSLEQMFMPSADVFVVFDSDASLNAQTSFGFYKGVENEYRNSRFFSYMEDEQEKYALVYSDTLYTGITAADITGTAITPGTFNDFKTIVFESSNGTVIAAFGTTAVKFGDSKDEAGNKKVLKALDSFYGVYEIGGTTYTVDGLGGISWEGAEYAVYTAIVGEDGKYDVYDRERHVETVTETIEDSEGYTETIEKNIISYINKAYYVMTVENNAVVQVEKIMIAVDFATGDGFTGGAAVAAQTYNKNMPIDLPVAADTDTLMFDGWYTDAACTTAVTLADGKYTPTEAVTLYSKWREKITVTLHINYDGAEELDPVYIGSGYTADLDEPAIDGKLFGGWYTDAACTDANAWDANTPVTANIDLYAKWVNPPAYMRSYAFVYQNTDTTGASTSKDRTGTVSFDKDGFSTNTGWPFNTDKHQITAYDHDAGTFTFISANSQITRGNHDGFIDTDTGIIVISSELSGSDMTRCYLLIPVNAVGDITDFGESRWNGGKSRAFTFTYGGNAHSVFVHNNCVYFDVTFKTAEGADVAANACYTSPTLYVRGSDNTLIAKFGYDGTTMNELDGYDGITFTGTLGNLTVDGVKNVNVGGKTGTYTVLASGSDYTADAYIDGEYYELTLVKTGETAGTYTAVKRMVTLTYNTDYDITHAVSGEVNKNIGITLPVLTDATHVFRGWFTDAAKTEPVTLTDGKFIPTAETTTLYAKWDDKVTLTVVYATDTTAEIAAMENRTKEYGANDALSLDEFVPAFTSGKAFAGWYSDSACTTAFSGTTITANTTVYVKWIDAVPMYGTYYGWNLHGSGAKDISATTTSSTKLQIAADGTVTGTKTGNVLRNDQNEVVYDIATGIFYIKNGSNTYYLVYDQASGAVGVSYYSSDSSFNEDMYLLFNKFIESGSNSETLGTGGNMTGGKLVTVTFADKSTENLFVTSTRIYSGVTWTATDANGQPAEYTAKNVGNASTVVISDSKGNVIAKRAKDGTTWKELDEYVGEYSGELGKLKLNGVGGATLENVEKAGTYVIAAAEAGYTVAVTVNDNYYEVTLDKTGKSYTYVRPTATITFDLGGKGENITHDQNLNIKLDLGSGSVIADPECDGFIFEGWYDGVGGTGSRVLDIKPTTTDAQTVYAKWVAAVTLTIVKGDGVEEKNKCASGSKLSLTVLDDKDGATFMGYFIDAAGTAPFTATSISEDTTIYACWTNAYSIDFGSSYKWKKVLNNNAVTYNSGNKGSNSSESVLTLTVAEAGTLNIGWKVSSESGYDKYTISKNGSATEVNEKSGTESGTLTIEVAVGDKITFTYEKDSSGGRDDDTSYITSLAFTPAA